MLLDTEVGLGTGDTALDGQPAPLPPPKKKEGGKVLPQFSARVCYGQTAGWIKMQLGTKLGLGPDHIVLDGDPTLHLLVYSTGM